MSKLSESAQQAIQNGKLEETEKLVMKILGEGKIPTPKQVARPTLISAFRFVLKECGWIIHDSEDESQNLNDSEEEKPNMRRLDFCELYSTPQPHPHSYP